jgi:hypothetical protein
MGEVLSDGLAHSAVEREPSRKVPRARKAGSQTGGDPTGRTSDLPFSVLFWRQHR